jgi:hypothetical protein
MIIKNLISAMTRQPHDQFAKEYLKELLTPLGKVEIARDVTSEVREIDVWFEPGVLTLNPKKGENIKHNI